MTGNEHKGAGLPEVLDGHWNTAAGREKAVEYAAMDKSRLTKSDVSDFALANAVYMADRGDLDLIVWQTAAKERIRWLSVQLATKDAELSALRGAYQFVKLVGRLEHSADDDATYRNDGDSFDALDRLIAMARDLMTPAAALTHQEKDAGSTEVQRQPLTGRCEHKKQPGGCQLHNLQCGYPKCDQFPKDAPNDR